MHTQTSKATDLALRSFPLFYTMSNSEGSGQAGWMGTNLSPEPPLLVCVIIHMMLFMPMFEQGNSKLSRDNAIHPYVKTFSRSYQSYFWTSIYNCSILQKYYVCVLEQLALPTFDQGCKLEYRWRQSFLLNLNTPSIHRILKITYSSSWQD